MAGRRRHPMPSPADAEAAPPLRTAYRLLRARFGHQRWWPAESPLEMCVGAILVQNTTWTQASQAVARLKSAGMLESPETLRRAPPERLEAAIRCSGTYRVKARRLRAFAALVCEEHGGRLENLWQGATESVRQRLLAVPGIGPETADCMLLYAGGHPQFVVDAYTRRIFRRHRWIAEHEEDSTLRKICERSLGGGRRERVLDLWQDFHAQMVAAGKTHCGARQARCEGCPLKPLLPARPRGQ